MTTEKQKMHEGTLDASGPQCDNGDCWCWEEHQTRTVPFTSKDVSVPYELMHRLYNVLAHYANEITYQAPRIGGVAQGCPRGETPTPDKLVWSARWMLRELEQKVLKRDAWDWIGKYEPVGPHCDTCRCSTSETAADDTNAQNEAWRSFANTEPAPTHKDCFRAGWVSGKGYARQSPLKAKG